MELSKYVKIISYNDKVILYNTVTHSMVQLPQEAVNGSALKDIIDDESIARVVFNQ